ncbi:hypothetical protein [Cohnella sp. GCM10012308]|uniref:hypothetical protein n=1 Tax=Cohnella sp. GCM10012308 TaxID=3317329 RepID=UPI0036226050
MNATWLIRSQSIVTLAAGMIYPYYLLFLKNLGNSFSKYGLAFAVFTISSAALSQVLARRLDRHGVGMLAWSAIGMMSAMFAFPWVESYTMVLLLQFLMGVCNAMQNERTAAHRRPYASRRARCGHRLVSFLDLRRLRVSDYHRRLHHRLADDRRSVLYKRVVVCYQRGGYMAVG